jgi:hypothetical protein
VIEISNVLGFGKVGEGVFGLGNHPTMRNFDCHRAIQLVVMSQINSPEAPSPKMLTTR